MSYKKYEIAENRNGRQFGSSKRPKFLTMEEAENYLKALQAKFPEKSYEIVITYGC